MTSILNCTAACALTLVGLLSAGCGREGANSRADAPRGAASGAGLIVGERPKSISDMAPGDVIVSVNGQALTRSAFDELLGLFEMAFRRTRQATSDRDASAYRRFRSRSLVSEFVAKELLVQESRRRGLTPTPEALATARKAAEELAKRERKSLDEYLASLGRQGELIRADIQDQALIQVLRQAEFGDRLAVTEEDVRRSASLIEQYNEMCAATNRLVEARAKQVCEQLRAGADFAALASALSQVKDGEGGVWGEFARAEIEDANVRNAAFTLPVGGVSDPIDTEEGLVIIKVLERQGMDVAVAAQAATVKLARILFLLGQFKEKQSDQAIRAELERYRLEKLQNQLVADLLKQSRIEYPNGTNFWPKAKKDKR